VLTRKQKAALLLTSLDVGTVGELLKGIDPKTVQELAVELGYLDAAGHRNARQTAEVARQFYSSLQKQNEAGFHFKNFLREMLKSTVGEDKTKQIQQEIHEILQKRDPFLAIRSADVQSLSTVLETEHPQAVAVVLSELPPKKGSEILGRLQEGVRVSAISRMTTLGSVTTEARARIAQMVSQRLTALGTGPQAGGAGQAAPEQSLRKVAIIVRNLEKSVRDGVLEAIVQKDKDAGDKVMNLMVVWEDLPQVADRALQQGLRGINEQQLALALHEAAEDVTRKIRSNISARASQMIDEEMSLMAAPKKEDVQQAREKVVAALREMNRKGELAFTEES
jgi:flagellar motor switch protein FliG